MSMSEQEKKELKTKCESTSVAPEMKALSGGMWIKNAEMTSDDRAVVGSCWREYWQIFTQQDFPTKCPFCGQTLNETDIDGCHIKIAGPIMGKAAKSWSAKKFIIPGHHTCNTSIDGECQVKINIIAVEAIEK